MYHSTGRARAKRKNWVSAWPALVLLLFLLLSSQSVFAADLTAEQFDVSRKVRDGQAVTQDMHRRFWSQFSEQDRIATQQGATTASYLALIDQLAGAYTWSLYESRETGKPTKVPELETIRSKLLALPSVDQVYWQDTFAEQDRNLDPVSSRKAQANEQPWELFGLANYRQAKAGRQAILFNPTWDEISHHWPYPPMRLTLKWPYRWNGGCGRLPSCANWYIRLRATDTGSMGVRHSTKVSDGKMTLPMPFTPFGVEAIDNIPHFTVIKQSSEELEWRGFRSIKHISEIQLGIGQPSNGKREYRISLVVLDPKRQAAWLLTAVSSASLNEAEVMFNRLEGAIELERS